MFRLIIVLAGWTAGWWLLWRVPRLGAHGAAPTEVEGRGAAVTVTVVIPARNEAERLPALLASLAAQTTGPHRVLVIDDQSTDATAAIVRAAAGVELCTGEPLPAGWTGKAWACHQGSRLAVTDVLVFLDADVVLAPDGLRAVLDELAARGGLLSVQPHHRVERAYERFSALFNVIGMMGVGAASPRRHGRSRGAFGPVLACGRDDYEAVGGHVAVRDEIVEDIALAHRFRHAGHPVTTLGGAGLVTFRMYPEGLGQLVEGWSKNFATGAASIPVGRLFLIGFWITTMLVSVQSLIELGLGSVAGFDVPVAAAVVAYLAFAAQLWRMERQLGTFGIGTALAYPALVGIFVVVFVRSVWLTLVRRRVTWRGRAVVLDAAPADGPLPAPLPAPGGGEDAER